MVVELSADPILLDPDEVTEGNMEVFLRAALPRVEDEPAGWGETRSYKPTLQVSRRKGAWVNPWAKNPFIAMQGFCPKAAVRAMPARLLLLCLLFRSSWLTVEGDRHVGAAGVLHRRGGRAAVAVRLMAFQRTSVGECDRVDRDCCK